jgi:hypothetical protein
MIYKSYADLFHQQVNMVLQDSCNLDHNRGIVKRSVTPSGERLGSPGVSGLVQFARILLESSMLTVFINFHQEHVLIVITLEVSRWIANTEIGLVIFFTKTSSTTM